MPGREGEETRDDTWAPAPGAFVRLPRFTPGQSIGLLGGSFNPPHAGHRLISELALRRLRLDRLWWLATPGNPLKSSARLEEMRDRIEAARRLTHDPRIAVTGFEAEIGSRYTYDAIVWLRRRASTVRFVWIMGADNLRQFHRWENWRGIAARIPIAVIDRGGGGPAALAGPAAQALARCRVPENMARLVPLLRAPAWTYLHGLKSTLSSTALRAQGGIEDVGTEDG
jgi:nicotinate-nucleotide adenylyltransferase